MRRLAFAAAILLSLAVPVPAQSTDTPDLRIGEVFPDPDTAAGQREFVELLNAGAATVPLAGWKLRDAPTASGATNTFTFPARSLAPGERVVVWGGGAADAYGPAWSNSAAWNNAGDGASLLDPSGALVDWLGYGTTTPPAERSDDAVQAKPDKGRSLAFVDGGWVAGEPTPGLAQGGVGSSFDVEVANGAPTITFEGLPSSVRPGMLRVRLVASDPNGLADLASWSLTAQGTTAGSGSGAPPSTLEVNIPADAATLRLVAAVLDRAGANDTAEATLAVRWGDVELVMPATGLGLPALVPGQTATTQEPIVVRNLASSARTPRLDLGFLRGPVEASLAGQVEIGLLAGNATTWVPYSGAMQALREVAGGGEMAFVLRIHVPDGLPAGRYGASLAVVA